MASSDDHDGPPCAPGTVVDRYIVLDCLGQRGAGTAYVAHDPKLDRKVALELLPLEDAHLEQARAIAKLARPHVVQVLHVGTFRDQLFLVTEFVDGPNLREWLRLRDRRPKEILDIFVEAGRGLAAVHAAGLVHGDFKPDDVLVGEDGRARVTDFGRGHPGASALADQIRFCASLDEALQGKRPPRWLRDVLARGLDEAPERRYPSMDALLAELTRERRGRPRVLALTAVVLFLAIAGFLWRARGASGPPVCAGPEQKLSGIWDDARKEAISRAFSATGKPYAADAWGGVQTTLDAYTRAWGAQFTEACHAMHDRSGTSADIRDVRDLRMTCLAERVDEVKALTNIFVNADGEVVTGAFGAAQQLTGLATCSDTKALTALVKPPSDPAVAAKVDEIRKQMTEIKAMLDAGKYREVLPSAAKAVEAARATGYGPIQGEALMWYGEAQGRAGLNEAEATFYEAAWAADRSGDDRTRGRVWGDLLYYVAYGRAQPEKIPFFYEQGMAAISRLGGDDALQEELFNSYGAATNAARQFDTARTANEQALALAERLYGPESTQVAVITSNLANTYLLQGAYDLALVRYQRALAIIERVLG
ncbi:MAG TPA: serine/threonine-protein kinase, partial [Polyangiaceae bacterium]|nr:serine/threonine-protein kinase [Polyangiaceae bacterium]